jgi:hypothetical protein
LALHVATELERGRVEAEGLDTRFREERVRAQAERGCHTVLEEPVDHDDIVPRQLLAAWARAADELAMVDHELEVEIGYLRASRAVAANRVLDPAQPSAECEVTLLNRV